MSEGEMLHSTVVVMLVTWFPAWVVEKNKGLAYLTKRVFFSVLLVTLVSFVFSSEEVDLLRALGFSLVLAILSIFGAWFMYFCHDMFSSKNDE